MNTIVRIVTSIVSILLGFQMLRSVGSYADLLLLIFGVALLLLIPGFLTGPVIAHYVSFFPSTLFFPLSGSDGKREFAAWHKVAEIKNINRPQEALKDYKKIIERWDYDVKAYQAIIALLYNDGNIIEARDYYTKALQNVCKKDVSLVEKKWLELVSKDQTTKDNAIIQE